MTGQRKQAGEKKRRLESITDASVAERVAEALAFAIALFGTLLALSLLLSVGQ